MSPSEGDFDAYAFSKQPDYDEKTVRREFAKAVPLRTLVIYCYDPRAVGIPAAVAKAFGDVFPGEIVVDDHGRKVASTTMLFEVVVAGPEARLYHGVMHEVPPDTTIPWDITREQPAYHIRATVAFRDVKPQEYFAALYSGGRAPEYLRYDEHLLAITRHFCEAMVGTSRSRAVRGSAPPSPSGCRRQWGRPGGR